MDCFFERLVWKEVWPNEEFDADIFYDWAAENANIAFDKCIIVARKLGY